MNLLSIRAAPINAIVSMWDRILGLVLRSKRSAQKGKSSMATKDGKFIKRESSTGRFVHFRESGVQVDVGRYLKSDEGRRALEKIETASKQFKTKKAG
jgi:hypothetical protein